MYEIESPQAESGDSESVRKLQTTGTNELRLLYVDLDPEDGITWHTHVPGLDEVHPCLSNRARCTLERDDGSRRVLGIGPMEFVSVPDGARHEIETVGGEPHRSLSVATFDAVARLEAREDTSGTDAPDDPDEAGSETTAWQDTLRRPKTGRSRREERPPTAVVETVRPLLGARRPARASLGPVM